MKKFKEDNDHIIRMLEGGSGKGHGGGGGGADPDEPTGFYKGGETNPKHETVSSMENNPSAGFADGGEVQPKPVIEDSTLAGFAKMLKEHYEGKQSTDTPKGYSDGGDVQGDPNAVLAALQSLSNTPSGPPIAAVQPPQPVAPPVPQPDIAQGTPNSGAPMGQMMQNLNQAPPTDPSIYRGVSADQRAALMNSLLSKQSSAGGLLAQGAAGIGDAISNSFGHGGQHAMDDVQKTFQQNATNRTGAMDTQRQQKLQDMQANQEQQLNDPDSELTKSMQQTFKSAGINVPSGMPGSILMKISPDLGSLALKQATLGVQNKMADATIANQQAERGQKQQELSLGENKEAASHYILHPFDAAAARGRLAQGSAGQAPANHPQNAAAAPHGQTVNQNGHTYTWNGTKYE